MTCHEILKLEGIFDVIPALLRKAFFLVSVTIENILVTENHPVRMPDMQLVKCNAIVEAQRQCCIKLCWLTVLFRIDVYVAVVSGRKYNNM